MFGKSNTNDDMQNNSGQVTAPDEELLPASFPSETDQIPQGFPQDPPASQPTTDQPQASDMTDTANTTALPQTDTTQDNTDLLSLKTDALQQLTPLLGQLEQEPEEKFRTTMMLIQASDDKSLLNTAYHSALQITDEKVRAQAILDVLNEINYFLQPETN